MIFGHEDARTYGSLPVKPTQGYLRQSIVFCLPRGTFYDRLRTIPDTRSLNLRSTIRPFTDSTQYVEQAALQVRGKVQAIPCDNCERGNGRYVECVRIPNFVSG